MGFHSAFKGLIHLLRNITFDRKQYPPLPYEFFVIGIF